MNLGDFIELKMKLHRLIVFKCSNSSNVMLLSWHYGPYSYVLCTLNII